MNGLWGLGEMFIFRIVFERFYACVAEAPRRCRRLCFVVDVCRYTMLCAS